MRNCPLSWLRNSWMSEMIFIMSEKRRPKIGAERALYKDLEGLCKDRAQSSGKYRVGSRGLIAQSDINRGKRFRLCDFNKIFLGQFQQGHEVHDDDGNATGGVEEF